MMDIGEKKNRQYKHNRKNRAITKDERYGLGYETRNNHTELWHIDISFPQVKKAYLLFRYRYTRYKIQFKRTDTNAISYIRIGYDFDFKYKLCLRKQKLKSNHLWTVILDRVLYIITLKLCKFCTRKTTPLNKKQKYKSLMHSKSKTYNFNWSSKLDLSL